jgi:hypothetical protein
MLMDPPETIYLRDPIPPILYLLDVLFNLLAVDHYQVAADRHLVSRSQKLLQLMCRSLPPPLDG